MKKEILLLESKAMKDRRAEEEIALTIPSLHHNVNNPLAVILGHAESLEKKSGDSSTIDSASKIKKNVLRISEYLKTLQKIEERKAA